MVLNFIFPHKGTAIILLFPFTIQKKGKTAGAIFPFRSSFSSHQKLVSSRLRKQLAVFVYGGDAAGRMRRDAAGRAGLAGAGQGGGMAQAYPLSAQV